MSATTITLAAMMRKLSAPRQRKVLARAAALIAAEQARRGSPPVRTARRKRR